MADEFGGEIPCAPYTDNDGDHIGDAILSARTRAPAVLLANHGVFAFGPSPATALKTAAMVEDAARTLVIAMGLGSPSPIAHEEIEKWWKRYHETYGQPT
jgi:L-ribulose-5-phosphate 4-epimerase